MSEAREATPADATEDAPQGITRITVSGFKSIANETSIDIKPLTILAGANSSGKTSIMQPLLLLKQTLEATFDPGGLWLGGPNAKFTSAPQMFSRVPGQEPATSLLAVFQAPEGSVAGTYARQAEGGVVCAETRVEPAETPDSDPDLVRWLSATPSPYTLRLSMTQDDLAAELPDVVGDWPRQATHAALAELHWKVVRTRCFLRLALGDDDPGRGPVPAVEALCLRAIHLSGLGHRERDYPRAAPGPHFPGTFENYAASVILHWQQQGDNRPSVLGGDLRRLGLTDRVEATALDDTRVQLDVARPPVATASAEGDMVSIADVGFGVSQVLPVLVALLAAEPGRLVYIEQPELHLHPKAQVALATVLADAAKRGVRVVAETHSPLLVLAVQALVAEDKLSPEDVALHWFTLNDEGITEVATADLDEAGRFGDWPADFDDVSLKADNRYLTAVETKMGLR